MAFQTTAIARPPSAAHVLDTVCDLSEVEGKGKLQTALLAYLRRELPNEFGSVADLQLHQLTAGQSNPTYTLTGGSKTWVLRKKPNGKLLPSAHLIEREFTVLKALSGTDIPVPRVMHLCEEASVVGTPFYLMEYIHGTVFTDPNLPSLTPSERRDVYFSKAEAIGRLHQIDAGDIGLNTYGKPTGYCERQVRIWWKQFCKAARHPNPQMEALKCWLMDHIPASDALPTKPTITHGDYTFANQIFSRETGKWKMRAIVDWELSTLGDGWLDVACASTPFYAPTAEHMPMNIQGSVPGIPTEGQFMKDYASVRGVDLPSRHDWAFYKGLTLFKVASILQGVGARAVQGNASSETAAVMGSPKNVNLLISRGLQIVQGINPSTGPRLLTELDSAGYCIRDGAQEIIYRVRAFMERHIFPLESQMEAHILSDHKWKPFPKMQALKQQAQKEGLWNLFIPSEMAHEIEQIRGLSQEEKTRLRGAGLTNVEYTFVAELMGSCIWASEVFNCSAPDTGNMEILSKYGSQEQKEKWLVPLLNGEIRSCFGMTEKLVASSDATNIQSRIERQGDGYVLSGKKWWTTGAMHPHVKFCIFMGKTDLQQPTYRQQSMIIVPMAHPGNTLLTPNLRNGQIWCGIGVQVQRAMLHFGYDDAPSGHPEIHFDRVHVPGSHLLGKEGQGFEIAQSRLGPGRLHHCMRLVGMGKRALELAKVRMRQRVAFGGPLAHNAFVQIDIGDCAIQLRAAHLLVLSAADALDKYGNKQARAHVAAAKSFILRRLPTSSTERCRCMEAQD